ncbi:MAG: T9SS type A sorting domain-containing protein [Flavobacteriales bacterium]
MKKILSLLLFTGALCSWGQTTLINPSAEGGFELPGGFAGNGWTLDNGTATNAWYIGTVPAGFSGNSAYISNNSGTANAYTNSSPSVVHFYRDITFPAGQTQVTLSFNWFAQGETGFWDALMVHLAPTSYTPASSTTSLGNVPLPAPAIELGRFWTFGTAQTATISIPASAIGNCSAPATMRLIFTWKNDGSGGSNPPAAIDNINLVSAAPVVSIPTAGGTFTINNTLPTGGTNFISFTDAINTLNNTSCGFTGPVLLNVSAGQTFAEMPPALTATGTAAAGITFQRSGAGANPVITPNGTSGSADAGIIISGADYIVFDGIDINASAVSNVEYGYLLRNLNATNGATNNIIRNTAVTLNRSNTSSIGIMQTASTTGGGVAPTNISGANSRNKYYNISISNAFNGIFLNGNSTYIETGNEIGVTGGGSTTIGASYTGTPGGDIGAGTSASYGIQVLNQSGVKVTYCTIRNITASAAVTRGIWVNACVDTTIISHNRVMGLRNISTSSTSAVTGMELSNLSSSTTAVLRAYNNFISDLSSAYTGTASATRQIRGILLGSGGAGSSYNIDFNSISVSSPATISSTCIELGGSTAAQNIRNNILANYTGAQTGTAKHYCIRTTSATSMGPSVVDYNDYYIANATNGYVALLNTTDAVDIAAFNAGITTPASNDVNSISANPQFTDIATDLHTTSSNVAGLANGTLTPWVSNDIDNQARTTPVDLGADQFSAPATIDMAAELLVSPVSTGCQPANPNVTLRIKNAAPSAISFSSNPATVTVNVTGAATQTFTLTLSDNSLNGGSPLASGATLDVVLGTLNMSATGTYTFASSVNVSGDGSMVNNTLPSQNILVSPGTAAASDAIICAGGSSNLTLSGFNGAIQWEHSTDGGGSWNPVSGATTATVAVSPSVNTLYRASVCGNTSNPVNITVSAPAIPVTVGDTICGAGTVQLQASGGSTLRWYTAPTGGNPVYTGSNYTTALSLTDTFFVENSNVIGSFSGGRTAPAGTSSTTASSYGLVFDASSSFTLLSVDVYPAGSAGNVVVQLQTSSGAVLQSATVAIPAGSGTTAFTLPLNFPVPVGTGMRLLAISSPAMVRESSVGGFPYPLSTVGSITSGYISGTTTTYYYFYNWQLEKSCSSPRSMVIGRVDTPPAISVSAAQSPICDGSSTTLSVSSSNAGYSYTWAASPYLSSTSGASVTATPSATATYNVSASDAITGCVTSGSVSVAVNPSVYNLSASAASSAVCLGSSTSLSASSNPVPVTLLNEKFEGSNSWTTINSSSGGTTPANTAWGVQTSPYVYSSVTFASNDNSKFYMTNSDAGGNGNTTLTLLTSPAINTTGISGLTLSFWHYYRDYNTADTAVIQASADGGLTWNTLTTYTTTQGASNGFVQATINLGAAYENQAAVHIRFRYAAVWGYYWALDNVMLSGSSAPLFSWSGSNGFSGAGATVSDNPSAPTMYTVTATNVYNCSASAMTTVSVNPLPVVNAGADTAVCAGTAVTLSGSGAVSYTWDNGVNNGVSFTPSATTTYTVTGTDANQCSNTDQVTVTLNQAPTLNAGADQSVCAGTAVTLTALSPAPGISWNNGIQNGVTFTPVSGGTYIATVTGANNCTASDTLVLSVNALPVVDAGNDQTVCAGTAVTLSGSGAVSYTWNNGVSDATAFTPLQTLVYIVNGTDANQCSNSDSVTVTVNALPAVNAGADQAVCAGTQVTLNGSGAVSYTWNNGVSNGVAFTPAATLTYVVSGTDGNQCSNSDSVVVTVYANPVVNLGADISTTNASQVITAPGGFASYLWNTGATTQAITVSSSGTYSVTVTDANGCSGSDALNFITTFSVENADGSKGSITMYPNPTTDLVNLRFENIQAAEVRIDIISMSGAVVLSDMLYNVGKDSNVSYQLGGFAAGMYMLRISYDGRSETQRIVLNK